MAKETDTNELDRDSPLIEDKEFEFLSATVKVELGGLSQTGKVRPINEDHYLSILEVRRSSPHRRSA